MLIQLFSKPTNLPEPVERSVWRYVQHVVVQLQTLDVVKVVEDVFGKALQSVGAEVERVEALFQAAECLLRKSNCVNQDVSTMIV